jgi:hypothetical protein
VLNALQRVYEAQALRLAFFQAQLSPSHLRAYLDRLPDLDDVEAEGRALDFIQRRPFWSRGPRARNRTQSAKKSQGDYSSPTIGSKSAGDDEFRF